MQSTCEVARGLRVSAKLLEPVQRKAELLLGFVLATQVVLDRAPVPFDVVPGFKSLNYFALGTVLYVAQVADLRVRDELFAVHQKPVSANFFYG